MTLLDFPNKDFTCHFLADFISYRFQSDLNLLIGRLGLSDQFCRAHQGFGSALSLQITKKGGQGGGPKLGAVGYLSV